MNIIKKVPLLLAVALLASCGGNTKKEMTSSSPIIEKKNLKLESDRMTPEVLHSFGKVNSVTVSPDGQKILYAVSYTDIQQNKSNNELFVMDVDGGNKKQLTKTAFSESNPVWINGGKEIAFLSTESGTSQIWKMNLESASKKQISSYEKDITGFTFSPDESKILFTADVKYGQTVQDKYPDLPKATGRLYNDLMFKHWNEWVETIPHPFVADFENGVWGKVIDILEGEPFESPMKPFGGMEQLAWSPDGKSIAYTCKKKTGKEYAESTNSDIYLYDLEKKTSVNLTEGMMGYDQNPVFSPDGKYLAWESMEHEGWESDKNRLFVYELENKNKKNLSGDFDFDVAHLYWSKDSKHIYFTGVWHATSQIYRVPLQSPALEKITDGDHDYLSVQEAGGKLIATRHSFSSPAEIYSVDKNTGEAANISNENEELLKQLTMGKVEKRWVETTDNKKMLVWVIYPPHFDPSKKYPALLYCQGGPQSAVSQFWSYRWNLQTFAANDYIIVAPNRRGVPGFGREWVESISGDYGGQCMQDYFSAIDAVKQEPFVDEERLGCVGASFGGFSVYWMAGNHEKRFKAFISHCGMFNFQQMYLETEEMWFVNRDVKGPYWEWDNPEIRKSYSASPHLFVDKWDTPLLVIHGEKDYRILASQGMAAYAAARLQGIPSELLIFPDEGHWVVKPQNSVLWNRTFISWLDKWLK